MADGLAFDHAAIQSRTEELGTVDVGVLPRRDADAITQHGVPIVNTAYDASNSLRKRRLELEGRALLDKPRRLSQSQ